MSTSDALPLEGTTTVTLTCSVDTTDTIIMYTWSKNNVEVASGAALGNIVNPFGRAEMKYIFGQSSLCETGDYAKLGSSLPVGGMISPPCR